MSHFVISLNVFLSSEMLLEQVEFLPNIHILQLLQAVISLLLSFSSAQNIFHFFLK